MRERLGRTHSGAPEHELTVSKLRRYSLLGLGIGLLLLVVPLCIDGCFLNVECPTTDPIGGYLLLMGILIVFVSTFILFVSWPDRFR